jgi:hypothetical protein
VDLLVLHLCLRDTVVGEGLEGCDGSFTIFKRHTKLPEWLCKIWLSRSLSCAQQSDAMADLPQHANSDSSSPAIYVVLEGNRGIEPALELTGGFIGPWCAICGCNTRGHGGARAVDRSHQGSPISNSGLVFANHATHIRRLG